MKKTCVILLLFALHAHGQPYQPTWESLDKRPVPQWYRDVKFGIFIHWGVYSVPGYCPKGGYAEWYQNGLVSGDTARIAYHHKKFGNKSYYQLADDFKAELFNPDEWARVFEKSGAKYIVLTSKHHDGFANWPSRETSRNWGFPWNAAETGPHRDLLGDLFQAVRKTSVHAGMYYSLYEWYNPLWLTDKKRYVQEHEWPQIKDLINNYKPDVFWTDGDWDATDTLWKSRELLAWMYNESPVKDKVVTFDRWGSGVRFHHGSVYTPEYQPDLDFEDHYWEESRGMGYSYGYNREEDSWDYNSAQSLVLQLIDKVSRGGNFLLDIGPDEHGKIPPIMQERLLQIGDWMKINGEAIYGTTRWRTPAQWSEGNRNYKPKDGGGDILLKLTIDPDPGYAVKECFFTYHPGTNSLYALLPKWPSNGHFTIHDLFVNTGTSIELLESHTMLKWKQSGNDLIIEMPSFDPNKIKGQYAYVLKISNTGAFAANPKILVNYPSRSSYKPLVDIQQADDAKTYYTLDGSMPDEHAALYSKPFLVNSASLLSVRSYKSGALPSRIIQQQLRTYEWKPAIKAGTVSPGLLVTKYLLESPRSVDELTKATPAKKEVSKGISVQDTLRQENTGLLYEGYIKIPADGIYNFYLTSDDGSRCWIDLDPIIDNDGLHGDEEKSERTFLKKGMHSFKLSYIQGTGGAMISLKYGIGGEGREKMDIPLSWFYH